MVNRIYLVGNLTAEPDVKATPKGTYVANMRLATNTYTGKDDEGNAKEQTEFHQLVAFGKTAEFAGQYLHKGRLVWVEGRVQTNTWQDTAGQKHSRIEVIVENLKALGPKTQEAAAQVHQDAGQTREVVEK
jgi:single-strand DNA-binding protein